MINRDRPLLSDDLAHRGLVYQSSDPAVLGRLDAGGVTVYTGFDPTADSLHVGHLLPLLTLRRLQEAGNRPIVVAGGGTGMIGDPSGKSEERNLLTPDVLAANLQKVSVQLTALLDFSPGAGVSRAVMVDNSTWLSQLRLLDFLREVGKHFSVSAMIAKDSVKGRLETREQGISYTEFSYMLLQAYDFLHLFDEFGCRLQMGASDQWGNITVGIDLIRRLREEEAWGLTIPLLTREGGGKFGKTAEGTVWLDPDRTSPYALYQFFLNTDDGSVGRYLRYLSFLSWEEMASLEESTSQMPEARAAQKALAGEVVGMVHGSDALAAAVRASEALFSGAVAGLTEAELLAACDGAPSSTWSRSRLDGGVGVVDLFAETGLDPSRGAARRTIGQGGAYVNNRRVEDAEAVLTRDDVIAERYMLLRKGKKSQHLVRFE